MNAIKISVNNKENIKRDIARFYLTGKSTLKSIMEKYNLERHIVNKFLDEVLHEIKEEKINRLF